ncbi:MAG: HDOD domain-containing protein [Rhodocyclaceae bacterium]
MHSAQELVTHIEALTSLPSVYVRIREELESEHSSMTEVAQVLGADPALTTRLLQVVNSALYGFGGKIDTVHRAVTILGLQHVHDLVLAMSVGTVFKNILPEHLDMRRFWRASVMCGLAAREIGLRADAAAPERLLVMGLLADVGHLVLFQTVPGLAAQALAESERSGEPLQAAERRIVGCDHAETGATLMDHWRLPACFAQAIGAQNTPRLGGSFVTEACILNLATHIVAADRLALTSEAAAAQVDPLVWSQLGLEPDSFGAMRAVAELDLASYVALLFPSTSSY